MKCLKFAGGIAVLTGVAFASSASAAVTISIDDVSVFAGNAALVGVYASSNTGDVISGFNLPFDINNDGYVDANLDLRSDLPSGFTLPSPALQNAIFTNTGFDTPFPQIQLIGADGIPTGSGANVQLGTTRTKLFDLVVNVDTTVPEGTVVPLNIFVPNDPFGPLFNVAGPNTPMIAGPTNGSPVYGSITVIGIPEPATIIAGLVPLAVLRRRRRAV